jgi:hypothetical protein
MCGKGYQTRLVREMVAVEWDERRRSEILQVVRAASAIARAAPSWAKA